MKSPTYYIIMFVLACKGIKKIFSQSPIAYHRLRKDDVIKPNSKFYRQHVTQQFAILASNVTEISCLKEGINKLLVYLHGGAFVSGPSKHHWDSIEKLAKETNFTVWMVEYPKAPEHRLVEISKNIDELYDAAVQRFKPTDIYLVGDSAGATLAIALVQRLVEKQRHVPSKLVLVSPVMDASLENPEIAKIDRLDPMLATAGVLSAKKMVAENNNLKDRNLSPIYGQFMGFPETLVVMATRDITYPDQKRLVEKLAAARIPHQVIVGGGMPHIWPLLPIMKESRVAFRKIISFLKK